MSKSIYEEALEKIDVEFDSWDRAEYFELVELVEHALEQAQKQEKLIKELKVIFNIHSLRLDRMKEWFNLQTLESKVLNDIEKLIKELENDKQIGE